jgi:WD40 repeat protein
MKAAKIEGLLQSRPLQLEALSDYVSAIAWSPQGRELAAASTRGEVVLWRLGSKMTRTLQVGQGQSIDGLAFSADGQFLAAGGQDGTVHLWCLSSHPQAFPATEIPDSPLQVTLNPGSDWVEHLAWSPTVNRLAFSLGRQVYVWDAGSGQIAAQLPFEASSVQGLAWHPQGQHLAVGGYQTIKIWGSQDWEREPYELGIDSASQAIAWSPEGRYLASANLDRTLTVLEWGEPPPQPFPWLMRGFPGKLRTLAWSSPMQEGFPMLASPSAEGIVVWQKHPDDTVGWEGKMLVGHEGIVQAVAFHPHSSLLASAAAEGRLCLWHRGQELLQTLEGPTDGYSCLQWHPQGQYLAAGSPGGELWLWSPSTRGQGFA